MAQYRSLCLQGRRPRGRRLCSLVLDCARALLTSRCSMPTTRSRLHSAGSGGDPRWRGDPLDIYGPEQHERRAGNALVAGLIAGALKGDTRTRLEGLHALKDHVLKDSMCAKDKGNLT